MKKLFLAIGLTLLGAGCGSEASLPTSSHRAVAITGEAAATPADENGVPPGRKGGYALPADENGVPPGRKGGYALPADTMPAGRQGGY